MTPMTVVDAPRVYTATRIQSGLYVQPSNDGTEFFVIARYEDGRAYGLDRGPWLATHWAWGPLSAEDGARIQRLAERDPDEAVSELYELARGHAIGFKSKREAVEDALR